MQIRCRPSLLHLIAHVPLAFRADYMGSGMKITVSDTLLPSFDVDDAVAHTAFSSTTFARSVAVGAILMIPRLTEVLD